MQWHWRLYIALLLFAGYGQMFRKLLSDTGGFSSRYGAAIAVTIVALAIIAKTRKTPVLAQWPWQLLGMLLCCACLAAACFALYLMAIGVYLSALLLGLVTLFLLPGLYQLYLYAFKTADIWPRPASHWHRILYSILRQR